MDHRRWFARNGELIHYEGRTYAMWSNRGGQKAIDWLFMLADRWPNAEVQVRIHEQGS